MSLPFCSKLKQCIHSRCIIFGPFFFFFFFFYVSKQAMRIRQCFAELMNSHELCRAAVGARGEACWGAGGMGRHPVGSAVSPNISSLVTGMAQRAMQSIFVRKHSAGFQQGGETRLD